MLAKILGNVAALVSTTVDAMGDAGEALVEEFKSIPQAIEDGWEKGIAMSQETEPKEEEVEPVKEPEVKTARGFNLPS